MPFHRLNPMCPRKSPVPIHDKSDVPRDGALLERSDEQLSEMSDGILDRRGGQEPFPESRQVH